MAKLSDEYRYELEQELRELGKRYDAAIVAEEDPELASDYRHRASRDADDISRRIREIEIEIEEDDALDEETWEERFARHAAFGGED